MRCAYHATVEVVTNRAHHASMSLESDIRRLRQRLRRLQTQLERLSSYLPDEESRMIMADFTAANAALTQLQTTLRL
jgi:hypothetical protein